MTPPLIAIYGSSSATPADLVHARDLGRSLGRAGYGIINGGYGGTMEAAAAGAHEADGWTVGVTCTRFTFRSGPNAHCDEVVEAATLTERIEILIDRAAGYVVLPGGNGTLAELSLTWEYLRRELLPPRPLVAWERPWRAVIEALGDGPYVGGGVERLIWVSDVATAVAAIRAAVPIATA